MLRDLRRKGAGPRGCEEIRDKIFVQPGGFVTQVDLARISQCVETFRQKQVGRKICVIGADGLGRFVKSDLVHPRVCVGSGEIGAPDRPVLVEQQARAKQTAVVVAFNRFLQVIDRFVDPVFLLEQQRGIEPRGRVL